MSTQLEFQLAAWAEQLKQRQELNDSLSTPRQIDHFFTFNDKKTADEAAITLSQRNFEVTVSKKGIFKAELSATHVSDLKDETVKPLITQMVAIAEQHSGEYDGFGATVGRRAD